MGDGTAFKLKPAAAEEARLWSVLPASDARYDDANNELEVDAAGVIGKVAFDIILDPSLDDLDNSETPLFDAANRTPA